jgi:hypothetical protein
MTDKTQDIRTTVPEELLYGEYAVLVRQAGNVAKEIVRLREAVIDGLEASRGADALTAGTVRFAEGDDPKPYVSPETGYRDDLFRRVAEAEGIVLALHKDIAVGCMTRWAAHRDGIDSLPNVGFEQHAGRIIAPPMRLTEEALVEAYATNKTDRFLHLYIAPDLEPVARGILEAQQDDAPMRSASLRRITGITVDTDMLPGAWHLRLPPQEFQRERAANAN